MATNIPTGGIRPVTPQHTPPYVAFFPEPATAQSRFLIQGYVDREEIAAAVEALVEMLDTIDGDPDLEDDDPAGQYDEDYYTGPTKRGYGPGCPISEPDHGIDDLPQGTPGLDC
ncbi:hypothetical protein [uncultured Croceicoccus sp.]|uniref:hypothetical protein n=1 Tax=uncultured Croceicoccus sp. TaxID=1295329 RepID=UPI002629413F|nr:hypothetical protein [uncultured Croceicoccus sp.]